MYMKASLIYLTPEQRTQLQRWSQREHVSMSELIRTALDRFLHSAPSRSLSLAEAARQTAGLWGHYPMENTERYVRKIRRAFTRALDRRAPRRS
jgi:hypothetical protein